MNKKDTSVFLDAYTCGKTFSHGYRVLQKNTWMQGKH